MGSKNNYVNELDRLIGPFIEFLDGEAPEVGNDVYEITIELTGGAIIFRTDISKDPVTTMAIRNGPVVYRQEQGRTVSLRPGKWLVPFCEEIGGRMLRQQLQELAEASKRHIERNVAFDPLPGQED